MVSVPDHFPGSFGFSSTLRSSPEQTHRFVRASDAVTAWYFIPHTVQTSSVVDWLLLPFTRPLRHLRLVTLSNKLEFRSARAS